MVRSTCGVDLLLPRRLKITSDFPTAILIPEADAHAPTARPELAILGNNVLIEAYLRNPQDYSSKNGLFFINIGFLDECQIANALIEIVQAQYFCVAPESLSAK